MVDIFPSIITHQYLEKATEWLETIRRGEHVAVLFFHMADRFWRIQQFIEDHDLHRKILGQKHQYVFQVVDLNRSLVEEQDDLEYQIARQINVRERHDPSRSFQECLSAYTRAEKRLVIVVPQAETYLNGGDCHILEKYAWLNEYVPALSILTFYNCDILHLQLREYLPTNTVLYDTVSSYPLYDEQDSILFLRTLARRWNVTLSAKAIGELLSAFGGHFWFLKEAVREIVRMGHWSAHEEGMRFRLEQLYRSLLPSELTAVRRLISGRWSLVGEEQHSASYMKKMRFLEGRNRLTMAQFQRFVLGQPGSEARLEVRDGEIAMNGVPVSRFFSRKEHRTLNVLLERKGEVVSRDEIAKRLWLTKTNEHYSDWAIDQTIARIRRRLVELSLPTSLIQTVRGQGYRWAKRTGAFARMEE